MLLIEYPGRGNSKGRLRPKYLNESSSGALMALGEYLGVPQQELMGNMYFLGHSFGCGVALQFAAETPPKRIVLVAPFDKFRKAAFRKIGPLAWVIPNGMDNCERARELCKLSSPPKIIIFHGSSDKTLPVSMGRNLAACSPGCVEYHEIPEAGHTDILQNTRGAIIDALLDSQ
jgi:pimeloyl-ACP methyl ester carboxylesterase